MTRSDRAPLHTYTILPESRLILCRFRGQVTLSDILRGVDDLWADPAFDPEFNGIANLEGVTTRAGVEELQALIAFFERRNASKGRWAVVFSEPKPTALGMIFKAAWPGPFNIEVVSTWEAACRHLHVELPAFTPGG